MIFSFLQAKICTPEKSDASQGFCAPERARSTSSTIFLALINLQPWSKYFETFTFYQTFLSKHVKRSAIIINKLGIDLAYI